MDVQYRGRFGTEQEGLQIFVSGLDWLQRTAHPPAQEPTDRASAMEDDIPTDMWIFYCARQLKMHWRTVDPEQLEELAVDLALESHLRQLSPQAAAAKWLEPALVPRE
jgi:hypothetical protein